MAAEIIYPQLDSTRINEDRSLPPSLIQAIRKAYDYIGDINGNLVKAAATTGPGPDPDPAPVESTNVTHVGAAIPGTAIATPEFKGDRLSIKMFGAKGDGVTDDSVAIQTAINWSIQHHGYPLHVPPGKFIHTRTINVWGGVRMYGTIGETVFQHTGGVGNAWQVFNSGFTLEGFQIWSNHDNSFGVGLALEQCSEYFIRNVFVGGGPAITFRKCFQFVKSGLGKVVDCNTSWSKYGMSFDYASYGCDHVIIHNTNSYADETSVRLQYGTNLRFLENYHESCLNGYLIENSVTDGFMDSPDTLPQTVVGINDCIFAGVPTAPGIHDVIIDGTGSPNTFKWNFNGGGYTSGVAITGLPQTLSNGITVQFVFTTGHNLNDEWKANAGQYIISVGNCQIERDTFLLQTAPIFPVPARPDAKALKIIGGSATNLMQFPNLAWNENTVNITSAASVAYACKVQFAGTGAFGPMTLRMKNNVFMGMSNACVYIDSAFIQLYDENNFGYRLVFDESSTPVQMNSGGGNVITVIPDYGSRALDVIADKLRVVGAGQRMLIISDNAASIDQRNLLIRTTGGKSFIEALNDNQTGVKNQALAFFMDTGNISIGDPATGMLATLWNSFTAYSAGARVIWPTHGYTYFAVSSTTGQQPDLFPAVWIALDHTAVDDGVNAVQIQGPAKVFGKLLVADLITPGNGILGYQPFIVPIIYPSGTSLSGVDTIPLAPLTTSGSQGFIGINDKGQVVSYQKPT